MLISHYPRRTEPRCSSLMRKLLGQTSPKGNSWRDACTTSPEHSWSRSRVNFGFERVRRNRMTKAEQFLSFLSFSPESKIIFEKREKKKFHSTIGLSFFHAFRLSFNSCLAWCLKCEGFTRGLFILLLTSKKENLSLRTKWNEISRRNGFIYDYLLLLIFF